jgi:hypothetical protein
MDDVFWYSKDDPGIVVYLGNNVFVSFNEQWVSDDDDTPVENPRKRWPLIFSGQKSLAWCLSVNFEEK